MISCITIVIRCYDFQWKMWTARIISLFVTFSCIGQCLCQCDVTNTITPDFWDNHQVFQLSGCDKSYFKIDIKGSKDFESIEYDFKVTDPSVSLSNEPIEKDIYLATSSNKIEIIASKFPYVIEFYEIKPQNEEETFQGGNGTIYDGKVRPYSKAEYNMIGYGDYHIYDLSWNLDKGLGFVVLETGNGRVKLFTNPYRKNYKVAVPVKHGNVKWSVITQKRPNPLSSSKLRIEHSLGSPDPLTTTKPPPTTTTMPESGEIQIYIVAVNEQKFYKEQFTKLWDETLALTNGHGKCNVTRTRLESCAVECSMTKDPDRGCLTFQVSLKESSLCYYEIEDFKHDIRNNLDAWAKTYGASRINLDDCLSSVMAQWISIAVLIPLGSISFVAVSYFLVKSWIKKVEKLRVRRRNELERLRRSTSNSVSSRKIKHLMNRTASQFEIVES